MVLVVISAWVMVLHGQSAPDARLQAQLKRIFPGATSFGQKEAKPVPHFKAFTDQNGAKKVIGYAYWTTELVPQERGYDGPIKMLVGIDPNGVLTGILVAEHNEPYGNFSVDPPEFARQFNRKEIFDAFKVGGDIDAVSRATITITSATRAVRNSSRRVARAFLIGDAFAGVVRNNPADKPK
jgi:NosR/NirI family nitrous oxide reductase transcriptional regulator